MSANLLDLSGKIDALTIAIIDAIATITAANDIRFFLVGATARDIILHYAYGIGVGRATEDIDLGVQVSDWTEFGRLKEGLLQISGFESEKTSALIASWAAVFHAKRQQALKKLFAQVPS